MWNRFVTLLNLVTLQVAVFLGALALGLMMVVGTVDAVGRSLFNSPLSGTSEIVEFAMGLAVFLAIPAVTRARKHVVIDLLDNVFTPVRRLQLFITDLINAGVFGLMAWQVWDQGLKAEEYGDLSQMLMLPMGPIYKTLSVLAGLATIIALVNLIEGQLGRYSDSREADPHGLQSSGTGL